MNQPEFGNELAKIRKAKGLTQSELAEKCEVSYRTIQRIESGSVTPRSFTKKTLSDALDFNFLKEFSNGSSSKKKIAAQIINLFNLKTNTMKNLTLLTVIFGLITIGIFTFSNNSNAKDNSRYMDFGVMDSVTDLSKREAIKEINLIKRKAPFHNAAIDIIKIYAKKSDCNFDTYVLLSKLIGSFGHSTKPAMEIANTVFLTYNDCDLINEIVPLIFLYNHNSNLFVKMAKEASEADTEKEKNKIRDQIINYREHGEFKTLKEAFNNQINI